MKKTCSFWSFGFVILFIFCISASIKAQDIASDNTVYMKVWMNDHTALDIPVDIETDITIPNSDGFYWENHCASVKTSGGNYEIILKDVDRITFEKNSTVTDVSESLAPINICCFHGDGIEFDIVTDSADIAIYSLGGNEMSRMRLLRGTELVSLAGFPAGIYILTIDGQSIKFMKK